MTAPAKAPTIPPLFRAALKAAGLPLPEAEYVFDSRPADPGAHPQVPRGWRFDFAWEGEVWPDVCGDCGRTLQVALEVEGGVWVQGRHTRGSGFVKDMEKYNEAAAQGWRILRVTPQRLCHPDTIDLIRRALDA